MVKVSYLKFLVDWVNVMGINRVRNWKNIFVILVILIFFIFYFQIKYTRHDSKPKRDSIKFNFQSLNVDISTKRINNLLQVLNVRESFFLSVTNQLDVLSLKEIQDFFKKNKTLNYNLKIFKREIQKFLYLSSYDRIKTNSRFIQSLYKLNSNNLSNKITHEKTSNSTSIVKFYN